MMISRKQALALQYLQDSITTELYYGGGAGGGKSYLGCAWVLKCCIKYPDTRWVIGRSELKTLKETTLVTFFKVCKEQGVTQYEYNDKYNTIRFFNNSIILLKDLAYYPSDPDFDRLGSLEVTGAFIDEAGQVRQKAKDILKSRIRHALDENSLIPKLLMTGNPSKNWVYKEFYEADKKKTLPIYKKFIQALVYDNPKISKHYIKTLRQISDESIKQRLLHGNWDYDDDPAQLISYECIQNAYTNTFVKGGDKILTADIASEGSDRFIIIYWDGWRLEKIYSFSKLKADEIEAKLRSLAELHCVARSNIVYDADGLGTFLKGYLRGAKPFHNGGAVQNGENYLNLKSQCAYRMANMFNENKVYINCESKFKEALEEEIQAACKSYKSDRDGKVQILPKALVKAAIMRSPDIWDAIMMRAVLLMGKSTFTIMGR